jgi:hypothetical protein
LPFFFVAGAFGMTTSAVVAARPSKLYREYNVTHLKRNSDLKKGLSEDLHHLALVVNAKDHKTLKFMVKHQEL